MFVAVFRVQSGAGAQDLLDCASSSVFVTEAGYDGKGDRYT